MGLFSNRRNAQAAEAAATADLERAERERRVAVRAYIRAATTARTEKKRDQVHHPTVRENHVRLKLRKVFQGEAT